MESPTTRITSAQAVMGAIAEEMRRGEDVGAFGGPMKSTAGLFDEFGAARVLDMPMSEGTLAGVAVGAALEGKRPVLDLMFGEFLPLVMQQLPDAGAMHYYSGGAARVPMVIRVKYGVGPFHGHAYDLHSWAAHLPGIKVVAPSTPSDAKALMLAAIRDDDPVLFIAHMALFHPVREDVPEDLPPARIGEARVVREGTDATIAASANTTRKALQAAERLEDELSVEVLPARGLAYGRGSGARLGAEDQAPRRCFRGGDRARQPRRRGRPAAERAFGSSRGPVVRVAPPAVVRALADLRALPALQRAAALGRAGGHRLAEGLDRRARPRGLGAAAGLTG